MKTIKSLMAGALILAFAGLANATPAYIYIVGSTAYRGNTHTAIMHILGSTNGTTLTSGSYAYVGTALSSAGNAIFSGTYGGQAVIIKTSWTGSEAGIATVSNGLTASFLPDSQAMSQAGTQNAGSATDTETPNVAMADTFQTAAHPAFQVTTLNDQTVGVVPFVWVASPGAPTGLDMSAQFARNLLTNGNSPISLLTGNTSDEHVWAFATGRDPDSGTRTTTLAEIGYGVLNPVLQYKPTITGQSGGFGGSVSSHTLYPIQTINGISTNGVGNSGESSGGTVAKNVTATLPTSLITSTDPSATACYYFTYLGTGDATNAIKNGAVPMKYHGSTIVSSYVVNSPIGTGTNGSVTYNFAPIQEGNYTFWGYEHLMYKTSLSGTPKTVADALATQLQTTDAQITSPSMNVGRNTDGSNVYTLLY